MEMCLTLQGVLERVKDLFWVILVLEERLQVLLLVFRFAEINIERSVRDVMTGMQMH